MKLSQRVALCWRILRHRPGNLEAHAERELPPEDGDIQSLMNQGLRELVLVFSTQGHSGMSAPWAVSCLENLLRFKPLGPLTGADSEWVEVSAGLFQNRRCGRVFKADGEAYDIDGRVFCYPDGGAFTNRDSRTPVTFPYHPTTEYVDVDHDGVPLDV